MRKFFLIFFVMIMLITNIYTSIELNNQNVSLNHQIEMLKLSSLVEEAQHKTLKLKISQDKDFLIFDYYNPKYNHIVEKFQNFENINLLMSISEAYGLDWKLFAVQIFYESSYDASAKSRTGAKGLMQLTSYVYGIDSDPYNEIQNVFIGVSYFHYLYKERFEYMKDENERVKFVLAAYHDGPGKVNNCRKMAKLDGLNPNKYSNIEKYLSSDAQKYVSKIIRAYNNIETVT